MTFHEGEASLKVEGRRGRRGFNVERRKEGALEGGASEGTC